MPQSRNVTLLGHNKKKRLGSKTTKQTPPTRRQKELQHSNRLGMVSRKTSWCVWKGCRKTSLWKTYNHKACDETKQRVLKPKIQENHKMDLDDPGHIVVMRQSSETIRNRLMKKPSYTLGRPTGRPQAKKKRSIRSVFLSALISILDRINPLNTTQQ